MALKIKPEHILFLDIETVPLAQKLSDLPESHAKLWSLKFEQFKSRNPDRYDESVDAAKAFSLEGGIFSEFGKIICISVGIMTESGGTKRFRLKSFAGDDEKVLLNDFAGMLNKWSSPEKQLCGHNIKEFDVPYICRRMIINGISLPDVLNIAGKKPWEVQFIDTLELWKFGDFKHYTSLNLLTTVLGIPTPKDDIDGSMVAEVYYSDDNLQRIVSYCEKDVFATAQVYFRFSGLPLMEQEMIENAN
ncbi:3'-5' exonuclease [Saccharicrinis sp. FJH62]|uniref:3'-5' exonuclease n=1 Tax=Saccharicrinis sp. FJH62 TaxID=3344657 RepID=UPI0035D5027F